MKKEQPTEIWVQPIGEPPPRAQRIEYPPNPRLLRMRFLTNLLDQAIPLPNGFRIGLDPIIGLIPGIGDLLAAGLSLYLIYQAALLGLPKRILARMAGNVLIESLAGTFPILGDLFDAVWKANVRNQRLVELHYHPAMPGRSAGQINAWLLAVLGVFLAAYALLLFLMAQLIVLILRLIF